MLRVRRLPGWLGARPAPWPRSRWSDWGAGLAPWRPSSSSGGPSTRPSGAPSRSRRPASPRASSSASASASAARSRRLHHDRPHPCRRHQRLEHRPGGRHRHGAAARDGPGTPSAQPPRGVRHRRLHDRGRRRGQRRARRGHGRRGARWRARAAIPLAPRRHWASPAAGLLLADPGMVGDIGLQLSLAATAGLLALGGAGESRRAPADARARPGLASGDARRLAGGPAGHAAARSCCTSAGCRSSHRWPTCVMAPRRAAGHAGRRSLGAVAGLGVGIPVVGLAAASWPGGVAAPGGHGAQRRPARRRALASLELAGPLAAVAAGIALLALLAALRRARAQRRLGRCGRRRRRHARRPGGQRVAERDYGPPADPGRRRRPRSWRSVWCSPAARVGGAAPRSPSSTWARATPSWWRPRTARACSWTAARTRTCSCGASTSASPSGTVASTSSCSTHPHEDHAGGLAGLMPRYRVGRIAETGLPGDGPGVAGLRHGRATAGISRVSLGQGDALPLRSGARRRALAASRRRGGHGGRPAPATNREVNDTSIVLAVSIGSSGPCSRATWRTIAMGSSWRPSARRAAAGTCSRWRITAAPRPRAAPSWRPCGRAWLPSASGRTTTTAIRRRATWSVSRTSAPRSGAPTSRAPSPWSSMAGDADRRGDDRPRRADRRARVATLASAA